VLVAVRCAALLPVLFPSAPFFFAIFAFILASTCATEHGFASRQPSKVSESPDIHVIDMAKGFIHPWKF
jgi:hypothetical protein